MTRGSVIIMAVVTIMAVFAGCWPSVPEVNGRGEILIPHKEGLFVFNLNTEKTTLLYRSPDNSEPKWARWSPDGRQALMVTVINGGTVLSTIDIKDRKVREIARSHEDMMIALWSPDGKKISYNVGNQLRVAQVDKWGTEVVLTNAGLGIWLPDSQRLLALYADTDPQKLNPLDDMELVIVDLHGKVRKLAATEDGLPNLFSVSPDGRRIAMVKNDAAGQLGLFIYNIEDGAVRQVDLGGYKAPDIAFFSPDGTRLAVQAFKDKATRALIVLPVEGGEVLTVDADVHGGLHLPAWIDNQSLLYYKKVSAKDADGNDVQEIHLYRATIGRPGRSLQQAIDTSTLR